MSTENNKLIADFMAYAGGRPLTDELLQKLYSDWNSLIPVLDRIESIASENEKVKHYFENTSYVHFLFGSIFTSTDIDGVRKEIADFIKWYNQQKTKIDTFEEILKSDHPLLVLEREILQSYTIPPNEKLVCIEDFEGNSFKTYAVYVNGEYDRKIHIRKY